MNLFFPQRGIIFIVAGDLLFPEHIQQYLLANSLREPPILKKLREETASHPRASMQINPEQGQFMALIVQLMGAQSDAGGRCVHRV